jgi:hypothetical protein
VWAEVQANIEKFFALKRYLPSVIQLQVCTTVNVFNVHYIDQVAKWLEHRPFNFVYWNMMHDAWYFSIANLPEPAKQAITTHLMSADIPLQYKQEFERIVDFMNRGAPMDGAMLRMKIQDLDHKRDQDFAVVAPEMAALINYVKI